MKNLKTRLEAIEITGLELIEKVEAENCECDNYVTDGTEWNGYTSFSATVENDTHIVRAFYLVTNEDAMEKELDQIDWEIEGYEVEEI